MSHRDSRSPFTFTHEFVIAHLDGAGDYVSERDDDGCYRALVAFQRHIRLLWRRHLRRRAPTVPGWPIRA